uniref:UMOD/GP2/OIT3-like D8C domain-containing protein n=1 Tax=Oryzias latipes TaxID=8090 RepID=A0A3B3I843_ORYLA
MARPGSATVGNLAGPSTQEQGPEPTPQGHEHPRLRCNVNPPTARREHRRAQEASTPGTHPPLQRACQHYTELNDNWLSEYNINGNSYCSGSNSPTEGWYRMFVGQTSAQIPETCVQDSRCSSYNRLQMTQPHPTQYNQTVTRSLCYSYDSSCCSDTYSDTIKVKLCYGDYYVYKLQTLPGCNTAYCAVTKCVHT